jgi:hypothetical protein
VRGATGSGCAFKRLGEGLKAGRVAVISGGIDGD